MTRHFINYKEAGVTLIELIVALAIMSLFLLGLFTFFFFQMNLFDTGTERVHLQHNLRRAAEIITTEIRKATEIELLNFFDPESMENGRNYIYLGGDGNRAIMNSKEGAIIGITGQVVDQLSFTVSGNKLQFTIEGSSGKQSFELNSQIYLLNTFPAPAAGAVSAIAYTSP